MACFLVPMVQAIATTAYRRHIEKNMSEGNAPLLKSNIPALEKMLWGGTVMLIVDHIINGEIIFRFPFFSAFTQTGGAQVFLKELLTVGVPMSLAITAVWALWAVLKRQKNLQI
ncbi:MAG: hypothetical protein ACI4QG_00275 [Candidatus Cryptobacteroides sp.]